MHLIKYNISKILLFQHIINIKLLLILHFFHTSNCSVFCNYSASQFKPATFQGSVVVISNYCIGRRVPKVKARLLAFVCLGVLI